MLNKKCDRLDQLCHSLECIIIKSKGYYDSYYIHLLLNDFDILLNIIFSFRRKIIILVLVPIVVAPFFCPSPGSYIGLIYITSNLVVVVIIEL